MPDGAAMMERRPGALQFFVALLLANLAAGFSGFAAMVIWNMLFHPAGFPAASFSDIAGGLAGLALFAVFVSAGVFLYGGIPALIIGVALRRTGRTSLCTFAAGGLLTGLAGYTLLRLIVPNGANPIDDFTMDFRGGLIAGVVVGSIVAGFVGHRMLVGRTT